MSPLDDFPQIGFADHVRDLRWAQGEHVFISGPTGSGKTTLAKSVLEKRGHVIGFGTKAHDPTLKNEYKGWQFVEHISDVEPWMNRVILWPKPKRKEDTDAWLQRQRKAFADAYNVLLKATGWCVFVDELAYMTNPKFGGVGRQIEMMHYIGRSAGLSAISLAQRPAFVPLAVISNTSHAYIAQTHLSSDLKRLADLGGVDQKSLSRTVTALPTRHDFVYQPTLAEGRAGVVNTRK